MVYLLSLFQIKNNLLNVLEMHMGQLQHRYGPMPHQQPPQMQHRGYPQMQHQAPPQLHHRPMMHQGDFQKCKFVCVECY